MSNLLKLLLDGGRVAQIVERTLTSPLSVASLARQHGVALPDLLYQRDC
jgi:hypothetical protein